MKISKTWPLYAAAFGLVLCVFVIPALDLGWVDGLGSRSGLPDGYSLEVSESGAWRAIDPGGGRVWTYDDEPSRFFAIRSAWYDYDYDREKAAESVRIGRWTKVGAPPVSAIDVRPVDTVLFSCPSTGDVSRLAESVEGLRSELSGLRAEVEKLRAPPAPAPSWGQNQIFTNYIFSTNGIILL